MIDHEPDRLRRRRIGAELSAELTARRRAEKRETRAPRERQPRRAAEGARRTPMQRAPMQAKPPASGLIRGLIDFMRGATRRG